MREQSSNRLATRIRRGATIIRRIWDRFAPIGSNLLPSSAQSGSEALPRLDLATLIASRTCRATALVSEGTPVADVPRMLTRRTDMAALALGIIAIVACGKGGSDGESGSEPKDIAFHAEAPVLPGFSYDTGLIPASGPAQVSFQLSAGGTIVVDAAATT